MIVHAAGSLSSTSGEPIGDYVPSATPRTPLTQRERQTLQLLLAGLSAKGIADRLGISPNTAVYHTKAIYRHFGVSSRATLLARVLGCDGVISTVTLARLPPREKQTLRLLLTGLSTKRIADHLGISPHTAAQYTKSIFRRFGVGSRAALLAHLLGGTPPLGEGMLAVES